MPPKIIPKSFVCQQVRHVTFFIFLFMTNKTKTARGTKHSSAAGTSNGTTSVKRTLTDEELLAAIDEILAIMMLYPELSEIEEVEL
jgi:hypothetical protein